MGDNGIINGILRDVGVIREPLPLMYNFFGAVVGLVQFTLPFMVLSLIGIIRSIHPSLEEAARSLGANRWTTFWRITFPAQHAGHPRRHAAGLRHLHLVLRGAGADGRCGR